MSMLAACATTTTSMESRAPDTATSISKPAPRADVLKAQPGKEGVDVSLPVKEQGVFVPRVQIYPGTGTVVGAPQSSGSNTQSPGDQTLNFVNADIRDVVRAVLGEFLGLNFAIDPKVQGQITLQTHRPIPRDSVLPVFEDVLRLNGIAILRSGDVLAVVPGIEARSGSGTLTAGLRVVPLNFISATEMQAMLKGLIPNENLIRPIPGRNVLLIGGAPRDVEAIVNLVGIFDVDWLTGMSTALYRPRFTDARTLRSELAAIVGTERNGAGAVRLIVMPSLNAVLAVARSQVLLRQMAVWVERLDQGSASVDQKVFIYNVQHGRAADLAALLSRLFNISGGAGSTASDQDDGKGSGIDSNLDPGSPMGEMSRSGTSSIDPRTVNSQPGRGPSNSPLAGSLGGTAEIPDLSAIARVRGGEGGRIRVIADEANNALIILAAPLDYRMMEGALEKLDIAPLQVLIEAVVAEVTLTDELKYGVQWFLKSGKLSSTLTTSASSAVTPAFPGFATILSNVGINVVLSALDSITRVRVVSSPSMMVLNNRTANLLVGDQVPIATQQAVSTIGAGAPLINSIQYRDTGVILKVTPRVNANGIVGIEISQEVSGVTQTTSSSLTSPTIQQRKFSSTLNVRDGETIALGGLIQDQRENDNSGIPVLKDIFAVGSLFGTKDSKLTRTEVLVLITPHVVRSDADIRAATEVLRSQLSAPSSVPPVPHQSNRAP